MTDIHEPGESCWCGKQHPVYKSDWDTFSSVYLIVVLLIPVVAFFLLLSEVISLVVWIASCGVAIALFWVSDLTSYFGTAKVPDDWGSRFDGHEQSGVCWCGERHVSGRQR